jgi:hypothetical protein
MIFAFGRHFFTHFGYVLDLVVVSVSLGVEIGHNEDVIGLLIFLRLWRVVRIFHGVYVAVEFKLEKLEETLKVETELVETFEYDLSAAIAKIYELSAKLQLKEPDLPRFKFLEFSNFEVDPATKKVLERPAGNL